MTPTEEAVRASSESSGLVNMKTTNTSIRVVSPRVKAKPLTEPMASMNKINADSNDTASAIKMV